MAHVAFLSDPTPSAFAGEMQPACRRQFAWKTWVASALLAASIAAGSLGYRQWARSEAHRLTILASAAPAQRHFGGRIAGFSYRSFGRGTTRGTMDASLSADKEMLSFLTSFSKIVDLTNVSSAADYHLLGIFNLETGSSAKAVAAFERALVIATGIRDPQRATDVSTNAALLTDLSTAYLERGMLQRNAADHIRALECADRAWRLRPTDETRWNRAVSLQSLHLNDDARDAWREYLQRDPSSAWTAEARERMRQTEPSSETSLWHRDGQRLMQLPREQVERLSVLFPLQVRKAVEQTILPAWAAAVLKGDTANAVAALDRVRWIAATLQRKSGESLLIDVVSNLDRSDNASRKALARCVLTIAEAKAAYADNNGEACRAKLRSVLGDLGVRRSPLLHYARFYIASSYYFDNDYASLRRETVNLANIPIRYKGLHAQTSWIIGLGEMSIGRPENALPHYQAALSAFTELGESELVGAVHNLLAEAYEYLDNPDESWKHRERALELFSPFASATYYVPLLQQSAQLLLATGQPAVAKIFLDRTLKVSAVSDPLLFADTLSWQATAMRQMGRTAEAEAMLKRAVTAAETIKVPALRERALNDVTLTRALMPERGTTPADLQRAVAFARNGDNRWALPRLLRLQADVLARQGDYAAAMRGYGAAVDEIVDQRRKTSLSQYEMLNRTNLTDTTEHAVSLAVGRGDYEAAFRFSEHSAGAAFRELPPPDLAHPPANVAVIKIVCLPDQTLIWTITASGATVRRVRISRDAWNNAGDEEKASLFGRVIVKHDLVGPAVDTLVIVPDAATATVPFEAVIDPATGRRLAERYVVAECHSVAGYLRAAARDGEPGVAPPLLIAGTETSGLGSLPEVSSELRGLQRLYPSATVWKSEARPMNALPAALEEAGLIHFATHGVVDRANELLSNIVLGEGAILYAHEVAALRLKRRPIVVLSACSGAATAGLRRRRAPTLADAFLAAGASAVVAWSDAVDDSVARRTSLMLHERLRRGMPVGKAVREVQLELAREGPLSSDLVIVGDPSAMVSLSSNV
jgi:tetratricopeptide (TPR) repeat protein